MFSGKPGYDPILESIHLEATEPLVQSGPLTDSAGEHDAVLSRLKSKLRRSRFSHLHFFPNRRWSIAFATALSLLWLFYWFFTRSAPASFPSNFIPAADASYYFVFGDSYSSSGYDPSGVRPNDRNPIGNPPFPGVTWCGDGPGWVGPVVGEFNTTMIYAYDYAYPSYDSTGLGSEIINSFIPNEATKPSWAPWTAENSLFFTWIGINDLIYGDGDTDRPLDLIFHYQEMLYEYGARRFLLFDIPTIERSPGGREKFGPFITEWNGKLRIHVDQFVETHPDVYAEVFSTYDYFSRVMDNAQAFGFASNESMCENATCMWCNSGHPGTAFYRQFGIEVSIFLEGYEERYATWSQGQVAKLLG